jgi:hypothetical protein
MPLHGRLSGRLVRRGRMDRCSCPRPPVPSPCTVHASTTISTSPGVKTGRLVPAYSKIEPRKIHRRASPMRSRKSCARLTPTPNSPRHCGSHRAIHTSIDPRFLTACICPRLPVRQIHPPARTGSPRPVSCKAVPWAVRARSEPRAGHGCEHPMGRRNNKCKSSCGSQPNGPSELPRTGHSPPALARQCELVLRR